MYKFSVAISMTTLNEESKYAYLDYLKKGKIERLFITGIGTVYYDDFMLDTDFDRVKDTVSFFQDNGIEVGIWISGFGHGCAFRDLLKDSSGDKYTNIKGVDGVETKYGYCPLDENFREIYCKRIKMIAELGVDMIQLDDDFRMNYRAGVTLACFCDLHLKEYYKRIGEELSLDVIKEKILTGGKNKYRTEYMKLCRESLLGFAKMLRDAVDEVNPNIRLSSCGTMENWDAAGTDVIEVAKTFAGKTKPFSRTNAGPYWHKGGTNKTLIDIIEFTRMQAHWFEGHGIEIFAEGDTFPRPRYEISSSLLELFDISLFATNSLDGDLKYMFSYDNRPDYETGYIDRHIKNESIRNGIAEIFKDKTPVGPRVISTLHIAENMDVPDEFASIRTSLKDEYRYLTLLSSNSISTAYDDCGYPALVVGENAKYVTEEDLKNGAIIDVRAAQILNERGFDTGLISAKTTKVSAEVFNRFKNDVVYNVETNAMYQVEVKDGAEVLSTLMPTNSPSTYIYNNFYVFALDMTYMYANHNYFFSYYRQADLIYALEKIGKKKLPVVARKNPSLYVLTSRDKDSMSVLLSNIHEDDITNGVFELDREYKSVRFVNCKGRLEGSNVIIDEITPFGVAAFEVK